MTDRDPTSPPPAVYWSAPPPPGQPGISLGQGWSFAFALLRQPRVIALPAGLAALAALFSWLLFHGVNLDGLKPGMSAQELVRALGDIVRSIAPGIIAGLIVNWVLGSIAAALVLRSVVDAAAGRTTRTRLDRESLGLAWRLLNLGALTGLAVGLVGIGGVAMAVILGIKVGPSLGVLVFILALLATWLFGLRLGFAPFFLAQGSGVVTSLGASWRATSGLLVRLIGWTLATALLAAFAASIAGSALTLANVIAPPLGQMAGAAIGVVISLFGTATLAFLWSSVSLPWPPLPTSPGQPGATANPTMASSHSLDTEGSATT